MKTGTVSSDGPLVILQLSLRRASLDCDAIFLSQRQSFAQKWDGLFVGMVILGLMILTVNLPGLWHRLRQRNYRDFRACGQQVNYTDTLILFATWRQ